MQLCPSPPPVDLLRAVATVDVLHAAMSSYHAATQAEREVGGGGLTARCERAIGAACNGCLRAPEAARSGELGGNGSSRRRAGAHEQDALGQLAQAILVSKICLQI
jgi:hypothetical protein